MGQACWKCAVHEETSSLGLCAGCRDWLHTDTTLPPGPTLLAPGTLPEHIGPYRAPTDVDYKTVLQAPE